MSSQVAPESELLRKKTIEAVKHHKASWVELGQYLYTVHQDKHFREWGHLTFEAYCLKELHLKLATGMKLLRSYQFLEKEEPRFVKQAVSDQEEDMAKPVPSYESVNLLRLARENKEIAPEDFADLRHAVLEQAREPKEIRSQVKKILTETVNEDSEEGKRNRRNTKIKRIVTLLLTAKHEMESENLIPKYLLKQIDELKQKLEDQLEIQ